MLQIKRTHKSPLSLDHSSILVKGRPQAVDFLLKHRKHHGFSTWFWLVAGPPLWKILVNWDDYSLYMGKYNSWQPNHQPVILWYSFGCFDASHRMTRLLLSGETDSAPQIQLQLPATLRLPDMAHDITTTSQCQKPLDERFGKSQKDGRANYWQGA